MSLTDAAVDDRYTQTVGRVLLSGVQALTRLPMLQRERDRAAGLNTAGYVSGYRGSPLGGFDLALHEAESHLAAHDVRFQPGVNEELAATAIWGTQQLHLFPKPERDGVFAMWYGKGPGVDRCGDVFKHANYAGTAAHGGVLVVAGDDHAARSSAVAHQSEHTFSACAIPVLAPAGVQDILDFGLHGWAMSRYTGCWVALKLAADVVESSATVRVDQERVQPVLPHDFELPVDGVHIRWPDPQLAQDQRMQATKIYAAAAYVRANRLDRLVIDSPHARLGLVACGKAWLDLQQALHELGIDEARALQLGLRVYKVAMPWPLEAAGARRFATGLEEILVVEEKRQIIEYQLKEMLYGWRDEVRPRVVGKFDETGEWPAPPRQWLLSPTGEITPSIVARALALRLARLDPQGGWDARCAELLRPAGPAKAAPSGRMPYFCSGCPHNSSTRVPDGSYALGGVGCHLMAVTMNRSTLTICQMGGEGAAWLGMAGHSGLGHVFANMGDGTYYHSGLLAIRAAVAAGVDITYKLLFNDAVAMTGGQPIDGPLTVPQLTRQLDAEGVRRIVVLADDPGKYPRHVGFAPAVQVLARERLDDVQRELRATRGVSVLIYDQTCATEARRRRRRGALPALNTRVFIHEAVCEGCGDCSAKSNCLSVVPVQTEFGTKRVIDPYTCNLDLSCLAGCCPAMVTVEGAALRRPSGVADAGARLPEPVLPALDEPYSILVAGVGGTGVVTIGALIAMAAHLEGKGATVLDQTGLAQKGGAVLTHVRLGAADQALHAPRIVHADVMLGCDLLVAAAAESLQRVGGARTMAVLNTAQVITGEFVRQPDKVFPLTATLALLRDVARHCETLDASRLARLLVGHSIAANMFLLGYAWQKGWIPVGRAALERAVELNGVAVTENLRAFGWGRRAAADPAGAEAAAARVDRQPEGRRLSRDLDEVIARRRSELVAFQDEALAQRYQALVDRVRAAERAVATNSERLTAAVARQAYRLMAYKDEYEVARLYSTRSFDDALATQFADGERRLTFHLSMPWSRRAAGGAPRKRAFGVWMRGALRLLAHGKRLRGTILDPFGRSDERRMERALIGEYVAVLDRLVAQLSAERLDAAVAIAEAPQLARGFGPVKAQGVVQMRARWGELLSAYEAEARSPPNAALAPASSAPKAA